METIEKNYADFERLMIEEKSYLDGTLSFKTICLAIGADQGALDSLIQEELGFSGQSLIDYLRAQDQDDKERL